ncbi:hypothetical protein E2C01_056243 [Portunus trituberculatus]|uniref:Uncharacterized protein n=1 Tax=Portunus trituberculatus TaxID=210409 RepID=A0A5B7GPW1_PORTR|nr:hypothetical protein [Portunus trituberculatus]
MTGPRRQWQRGTSSPVPDYPKLRNLVQTHRDTDAEEGTDLYPFHYLGKSILPFCLPAFLQRREKRQSRRGREQQREEVIGDSQVCRKRRKGMV